MRAVIVSEYGGSPHVEDVPPPEVQAGQVLIKVLAAGMNPMDRAIADGGWKSIMPATFPMILGADAAGIVEQTGEGADRFSVGDQVFGQLLIPRSDRQVRTRRTSQHPRRRRWHGSRPGWIQPSRRPCRRRACPASRSSNRSRR